MYEMFARKSCKKIKYCVSTQKKRKKGRAEYKKAALISDDELSVQA